MLGCTESLLSLRAYNRRAKLCVNHLRADCVATAAGMVRFCQKCHRLQPLGDFEGDRHTCRAALVQRSVSGKLRRAAKGGSPQAAAPPPFPHLSPGLPFTWPLPGALAAAAAAAPPDVGTATVLLITPGQGMRLPELLAAVAAASAAAQQAGAVVQVGLSPLLLGHRAAT